MMVEKKKQKGITDKIKKKSKKEKGKNTDKWTILKRKTK